jgi:DNA-binding transcriptional MerR regulator
VLERNLNIRTWNPELGTPKQPTTPRASIILLMPDEAADKRYKIGEVCKIADVAPYVLRYWETEFPALAPGKSGGGQRLYTHREVDIILRIKQLLYSEGFTIAGAKKKLETEGADPAPITEAPSPSTRGSKAETAAEPSSVVMKTLSSVRRELAEILAMLEQE